MQEESILHRALALGAIALAVFGGVTAIPQYEAPPPPVSVVIVPEEQRARQAPQPNWTYSANEPVAGPAPFGDYRLKFSGPTFTKTVDVSIPNHLAGSIYMGNMKLAAPGSEQLGMAISYQATQDAPHFVVYADAEYLKRTLDNWVKQPLDLGALPVDRIEITPVSGPTVGRTPIPTLNPQPQQKPDESKQHSPEAPISFHTILDEIASSLSIAATMGEYLRRRAKSEAREAPAQAVKQVRLDHDAVSWTTASGVEHTVITKAEVENSEETDRRLIMTLSASIRKHFNLWATLYPDRDISVAAATRSDELQHSLCADFTKLKGYIERTGRALAGFEAIEVVCRG